MEKIIEKLAMSGSLEVEEYERLIKDYDDEGAKILRGLADRVRREIYGNKILIRGLIEISNICKNNCFYCGIRQGNSKCQRYRLSAEEIISCADAGYELGFMTFVLQGGEDDYFTDEKLGEIIREIKTRHSDCAVTLSLGERSFESYKYLRSCGADRYLLRHETADKKHYEKLHPSSMSYENRIKCLKELKSLGFQTGCGFMVGSPLQTEKNLAQDLKFIEKFKPDMCGIGPFIPHKDTPFKNFPAGSLELTCYLLSIIRLIHPSILLPATTALGTIHEQGREQGILAGANVIMPNLSPFNVRKKYELYNNKIFSGQESAQNLEILKNNMKKIGFEIIKSK